MGAGASTGNLPHELLVDAQLPTRSGVVTSMPPVVVSRDVLHSLRRRSFSEARRKSGARRMSKPLQPVYEIPATVNELLQKIGIHDTGGDTLSTKSNIKKDDSPANNRTTKLVSHIFDCLGALQHLVRADQGLAIFQGAAGEDEEAMEKNAESLGKLVHEMVTIYGLCGDTMRVILDSNPEAAGLEDGYGRLPLHVAVDTKKPWMGAVMSMIEAYPEALSLKDGAGRLPLHVAVDQDPPNIDLVKLLVSSNSSAAGVTRGVGRLPIHYAVFPDEISYEMLDCLILAYPEGCRSLDVYGRLPLHYAVDKTNSTNVRVIQRLLEEYPEGAEKRDKHNKTPLMIALDRSGKNKSSFQILQLLTSYSSIGTVAGDEKSKSLLSMAMDITVPNLDCIHFLASRYPESILLRTSEWKESSSSGLSASQSTQELHNLCEFLSIPGYFVKKCHTDRTADEKDSLATMCPPVMWSTLYSEDSPLYVALVKGWHDVVRVMLRHCNGSDILLATHFGRYGGNQDGDISDGEECISVTSLFREMNWRARRWCVMASVCGASAEGRGTDPPTTPSGVNLQMAGASLDLGADGKASADFSGVSHSPSANTNSHAFSPRVDLVMIPEDEKLKETHDWLSTESAPSKVEGVLQSESSRDPDEKIVGCDQDHRLLSDDSASFDFSAGGHDEVDDASIDLSVRSYNQSSIRVPGTGPSQQLVQPLRKRGNIFRQLYLANESLWKHVVEYL